MHPRPLPPGTIPTGTPAQVGERWHYPYTRIVSASLSADQATTGSYAGYVGKVASVASRHVLEVASLHPVVKPDAEGTPIAYGRWLIAGMASQEGSGSFSMAVASAEVSGKKNSLAAEARGLANDAAAGLRALAGTQLDVSSVRKFGEALGSAARWCVENAEEVDGTADPGGVYALVAGGLHPLVSACWALNSVAGGWTAQQAMAVPGAGEFGALRRPPDAVDGVLVAAAYQRLGVGPTKKPTAAQRLLATQLLQGAGKLPARSQTSAGWMVDVPPFVQASGSVCGLEVYGIPPARIRVGPWPAGGLSAPRQTIHNTEITANAAIAAGAAGLVEGAVDADTRYWRFGYLTEATRNGLDGTLVLTERYAAGFQAFVRFVSAEASVTAQVIAAKSTMKASATSMEVQVLGVDLGQLDTLPAFVSTAVNGFDVATVQALGTFSADVSAAFSDGIGYEPCLTGVEIDLGAPEIQAHTDALAWWCLGLRRVKARTPRAEGTVENGAEVPELVWVYDRLEVGEKPTVKQANAAEKLLGIGA